MIRYLRDESDRVTLSDLAEHIAAIENDTDVNSITSSERKRVYVGLYQCHLPKMADMGIIEFNQDRGIIEIGKRAPELYRYLDDSSSTDRQWHRIYLALTAGGVAVTGLGLALGGLALVAALVSVCVGIGVCSIAHTLDIRGESVL